MTKVLLRFVLCLSALSLALRLASAQTAAAQDTLKIRTDLVVVDAQVTDKKSREIIRGLKAEDFELFEDQVKQPIETLSQDKLPLSIILLLDISPSVRPVIEKVRAGALQALQRLKSEDEVALMVFSGWTELIQDFSKDRQLILDKLGQALDKKGGGTRIHEAVAKAARQMRYATNPISRRVIIVVTDNQGSMQRQDDPISEEEVKQALLDQGATVCGLIVRSWLNVADAMIFQHPVIQEHIKRTSVNPYAELTGGEMSGANKDEVNVRLGEMIDRLRNRYTLGYLPLNQKFDGKHRRIRLALTREARRRLGGEIVINHRQGYYAVDPDSEELLAGATHEEATPIAAATQPAADAQAATDVETKTAAAESQPTAPPIAESKPQPAAPRKGVNPYAHLMMVDVQVINKKTGAAATGLTKEAFAIEANGVQREVEHFSQGQLPLSIILLIDVTGNTPVVISSLRRSVAQWLGQVGAEDEIALMAFGTNAEVIQEFTQDRKQVAARFRNFIETARQKNVVGLQDRTKAVYLAADLLDKAANPASRRVIITITDDAARTYTEIKMNAAGQLLSHTDCVVYAVVTQATGKSAKGKIKSKVAQAALMSFGNPVTFAIHLATQIATEHALEALLKDRSFGQLVHRTGGALLKTEPEMAAEKLHLLLGHLRQRYVVGFTPAEATLGQPFHPLKLKLNPQSSNGLAVLTRQGYFVRHAQPGPASTAATAENKTEQP